MNLRTPVIAALLGHDHVAPYGRHDDILNPHGRLAWPLWRQYRHQHPGVLTEALPMLGERPTGRHAMVQVVDAPLAAQPAPVHTDTAELPRILVAAFVPLAGLR